MCVRMYVVCVCACVCVHALHIAVCECYSGGVNSLHSPDLAVWSTASEDIQRSLFNHFYDLLTHSKYVT